MKLKLINEIGTYLSNRRVLLRCDLNVPISEGKILDNTRIIKSLTTIKYLIQANVKLIIVTHLGRPSKSNHKDFSLKPVKLELERLLDTKLRLASSVDEAAASDTQITLLENIRFFEGEGKNDEHFARQLASLADIYINDAFSCCHRMHASVDGITHYLPSYAGFLLKEEIDNLKKVTEGNVSPSMAIVGGKKISTKIKVLENLLPTVDFLAIAGAMANTFLKATGKSIGCSYYEPDYIEAARKIFRIWEHKIILPTDYICKNLGGEINPKDNSTITNEDNILDIGVKSRDNLCKQISMAKLLLWNGPLGFFEEEPFSIATKGVASKVADYTKQGRLISIAGGGDTIAAIGKHGKYFSYVSTAGGAFLEWLEKGSLPAVEKLYSN